MSKLCILPLVLAAALGGCMSPVSQYSPTETSTAIKVTRVSLVHDVRFAPGQNQLSAAERGRLQDFVRRDQIGYGDRVMVPAATGASPEARRQSDAVAAALRSLGLTVERDIAGASGAAANRVEVVVARAVVTPPNCPNWSKPSSFDPTNSPGANFGCATAYNFATMVADPNDLLAGRTPGPADAEQQASSVNRYRAGRIIPLQIQTSRSTSDAPASSPSGGTSQTPSGAQQ